MSKLSDRVTSMLATYGITAKVYDNGDALVISCIDKADITSAYKLISGKFIKKSEGC